VLAIQVLADVVLGLPMVLLVGTFLVVVLALVVLAAVLELNKASEYLEVVVLGVAADWQRYNYFIFLLAVVIQNDHFTLLLAFGSI
jgi:hypothetical protein